MITASSLKYIICCPLYSHIYISLILNFGILQLSYPPVMKPSACTGIQYSAICVTSWDLETRGTNTNGPMFMLLAVSWIVKSSASDARVMYFLRVSMKLWPSKFSLIAHGISSLLWAYFEYRFPLFLYFNAYFYMFVCGGGSCPHILIYIINKINVKYLSSLPTYLLVLI